MNAKMKEVRQDLEALENESYARGWADGVDSAHVNDAAFIIVYGFFVLCGALMGGAVVWLLMR